MNQIAKELRDAAQVALDKTQVEHEQVLYTKLIAFVDGLIAEAMPPAPATNDNTPSSQS
jgi:hypothetical protein